MGYTDISLTKPNKPIRKPKNYGQNIGFEVDASNTVEAGQEVILHTNGKIRPRTAGTQLPIGRALKGGTAGVVVTVVTVFGEVKDVNNATGGAVNAGVFLVPDGTKTGELHDYVAAIAGDYVFAVTLEGGANNATIKVGLMESPLRDRVPA